MKKTDVQAVSLADEGIPVMVARIGPVKLLGWDEMFCVEYFDGRRWVRGPLMPYMEAAANFERRVEEAVG